MHKLAIKVPFWLFTAIFLIGLGVIFGLGPTANFQLAEPSTEGLQHFQSGFNSQQFFDNAYLKAGEQDSVSSKSAIIAHHLLVADKIAEVFESLASKRVRTVVVLSPNHSSAGKNPAQISNGVWETVYGDVQSDQRAVKRLLENADVHIEETTFKTEHGIYALTPFIKRSFPNAKLVPIVIDESFSAEDARKLGDAISDQLPNSVVIASVDMSHYQPNYAAKYHDEVTLNAIENGGCNDCELEIDANAVLQTLFQINKNRNQQAWTQTHHSSSIQMGIATEAEDNTSHILGYFEKGEPTGESFSAMHFLGDIMLDRDVRKLIEKYGEDYPWENMQRFLMGSHLVVANLEGTVGDGPTMNPYASPYNFIFTPESVTKLHEFVDVVSLANNHSDDRGAKGQDETRAWLDKLGVPWFGGFDSAKPRLSRNVNGKDIVFVGYHQFRKNIDSLKTEISQAKSENKFVIVYPHWGTEYVRNPSSSQKDLADIMIEAGADLIIGGHPHVAQSIGFEKDTPVVWSLGNFIFDQTDPDTWTALTVGVIIKSNKIELHLLPVFTKNGQPKTVSDQEAQKLFNSLAEISHPVLKEQIKTGVIVFTYEG